jgi:lipopolysaccharide transport system permease protein
MEFEIRPAGRLRIGFREIWEYRELFYFFTWRDIKVRYKQTFLGATWAVLQPVIMTLVFSLFFGGIFGAQASSLPYPLFVFPGMLVWGLFANGLMNASNSMVTSANIIKKIYFPRLIIPVSSILAAMLDFLIAAVLFIFLIFYYGKSEHLLTVLFVLPISLIIILLTLVGVGSFFAALNVKYRDFRYVIPFLVQVLFFLTPVIYPVKLFPAAWIQQLFAIHPVGVSIDLLRLALQGSPINYVQLTYGTVTALLLFIGGIFYFRKTENYFADLA